MQIKVYNDNIQVFAGLLSDFLSDNDNEDWLTVECKKLESVSKIEFAELSGDWVIERI